VIFRKVQESDHNMIRASFVETAKKSGQTNGVTPKFLSDMASAALGKCHAAILCDEDTPDEIIGWVIWIDQKTVFWLAVKPRYQKQGFGAMLLAHAQVATGFEAPTVHVPLIVCNAAAWAGRKGIRLSTRPYMVMS
jgi:GNAT superfamily N-acetyltransferase